MTDKEKIKAEIERFRKKEEEYIDNGGLFIGNAEGAIDMADDIIKFIDSLPEEPVNEDLEEAETKYVNAYGYTEDDYAAERSIAKEHFKAGAQWQKQQTINKTCNWLYEKYNKQGYLDLDDIDDLKEAL